MEYLYGKLYGDEGLKGTNGELLDCTECIEILCNNKVLDCCY